MFDILVAEDDKNTRKLMGAVLKNAGYTPHLAENGEEALDLMESRNIDLIILDIMMPKMDGYEFTRTLRDNDVNTPILMVSAKSLPKDRIAGFHLGIDDYMVKPVDEEELILRIQALLRRSKINSEHILTIGDVTLNYDEFSVKRKDEEAQVLPQKEFLLLYKLLSYPGKIFTRIQLMDEFWGMDSDSLDSTVTVHINRLRKRFEDYSEFSIDTVRGLGYKAEKHAT